MKRVALYARYSSDMQSARSCEDQLAVLRDEARRRGWQVVAEYRDEAISGTSIFTRPGILKLMADAEARQFDIAFSEALDRITRDDADAPMIRKRLAFHGVELWTQSEGQVQILHTALKGAMNAMFIDELARKVKRGHLGVLAQGRATQAPPFGYDPVIGQPGVWTINEAQADIVRRIFDAYAPPSGGAGMSPRSIAVMLNREGIESPRASGWQHNAIYGNGSAASWGIVFNPIYAGVRIYNRTRCVRNPATGKRSFPMNPESEWKRFDVPALRIVTDAQFARAAALRRENAGRAGRARRPLRPLSGLVRCGDCGANMVVIATGYYGCTANRNKGTCANHRSISETELLDRTIYGLRKALLAPEATRTAVDAFRAELARLQRQAGTRGPALVKEIADTSRRITNLLAAAEDGAAAPELTARLAELRGKREAAEAELAVIEARKVVQLGPNPAALYADAVENLGVVLAASNRHLQGFIDTLRNLVTEIVLTPRLSTPRGFDMQLSGDLAALLTPGTLTLPLATAASARRKTR